MNRKKPPCDVTGIEDFGHKVRDYRPGIHFITILGIILTVVFLSLLGYAIRNFPSRNAIRIILFATISVLSIGSKIDALLCKVTVYKEGLHVRSLKTNRAISYKAVEAMMIHFAKPGGWTLGIEIKGEEELVNIRGTEYTLQNIKANYTKWSASQKPT